MKFEKAITALWLAACLSAATLMTGCLAIAAAGAAGGGVAYVRGELTDTLQASVPQSARATEGALKDLGYNIVERKADAQEASFEARTADDTSVSVSLERETDRTTKVGIRYGVFGDERKSIKILETIKAKL